MKDYAEGCGIYVERWKGEMVERFPEISPTRPRNKSTKLYFVSSRASARLTRDPVFLKETSTNYTN
jgi:hypothetical protein